ncbi:MAG: putative bifunctional diguanylate cyclase/phosphodiesterase [Wenzhouxiangella sp.]
MARLYLVLALGLTLLLGISASVLVYKAAQRVAQSNQELVERAIADLHAISSFRVELAEHEHLAYELYAVIDAERFAPVLSQQRAQVASAIPDLLQHGMSNEGMTLLLSHWDVITGLSDDLIVNVGRVNARQTDWDAARAQLEGITHHRRQMDPLLDELAAAARSRAQDAEARNRAELTAMSTLVLGYMVVILLIAISVGWVLRRLFRLTEANQALVQFPASNPMPVITFDERGRVQYFNEAARDLISETLGSQVHVSELVPGTLTRRFRNRGPGAEQGRMQAGLGLRLLEYNWHWLSDGRVFYVYVRDITAEKEAEQQLERMAFEDGVTGLLNRHAILRKLEFLMRSRGRPSLALLSIERFHLLPRSAGFDAADKILAQFARELSERAREHLGEDVSVARLEGAVFALCWNPDAPGYGNEQTLMALIETLPLLIHGGHVVFHARYRIGVRHGSGKTETGAERLLSDADAALRAAEESSDLRCVVHDEKIKEREQHTLVIEDALRKAIKHGNRGLEVYLQPKVDIRDGRIVGAEALLRWKDPELGRLAPDRFVAIAEQSGLVLELGRWVCDRVLDILTDWRDDPAFAGLHLAVNAAPDELHMEGYASHLLKRMGEADLPPDRLEVEITERVLVDTTRIDSLRRLQAAGVGISIDDFGTGYSSFAYLSSMPVSVIKMDRQFVAAPPDRADLTRIIANLAKELGLGCVAEGVETLEQVAHLRAIGCHIAQGYLFSPALPRVQFEAMVREGKVATGVELAHEGASAMTDALTH